MYVGIDETGKDVLPARIDYLGIRRNLEVGAYATYRFVFTVDIRSIAGIAGDDLAIFDEQTQDALLASIAHMRYRT